MHVSCRYHCCKGQAGTFQWLSALKHPLVVLGWLITHHGSFTAITFYQGIQFQGDLNPRCTQGGQNIGQSNYVPNPMCASPDGGLSMGEAQVILTRLEPSVLPGMAAKSRILWNAEKEKRLMRLYEFSSADSSRGCARGLLGLWTLNYPEYPST